MKVASVTSSTVTLQWEPPETPNGLITKYSIQYDGSVVDSFGSETLDRLMGTVEGLSPDTEYVLQLRAHTRVGPGLPASLTVKTSKLFILQYNKKFWLISFIIYHVKSKYCTLFYCLSWATVVVPVIRSLTIKCYTP